MVKILIVGCGGHGKCCLEIARAMQCFEAISFLDDGHVNEVICGCNVIGTVDEMSSYVEEYENIFIAVGNNAVRKQLHQKAQNLGYRMVSLCHPSAVVMGVDQSEGCVIFPNAVVEPDIRVGKGCILGSNCVVNHDAILEEFVLVQANATVAPMARIGAEAVLERNSCVAYGVTVKAGSMVEAGCVVYKQDEFSFEVGV